MKLSMTKEPLLYLRWFMITWTKNACRLIKSPGSTCISQCHMLPVLLENIYMTTKPVIQVIYL